MILYPVLVYMRQKISYGFRFIKVICLLVLDFMIKKKKKDIYYL